MARSKVLQRILDSITPERQAELDAMMEAFDKFHEEHPDYNERYGTDRSYFLEKIIANGFDVVGITVMACEETFILRHKDDVKTAWETFKPEGWWYGLEDWPETREWYVNSAYDGKEEDAPKVYWLTNIK